MKDAAARRQAIRQQMQASGGFVPGQEPTPAQRARFDSVRSEMKGSRLKRISTTPRSATV